MKQTILLLTLLLSLGVQAQTIEKILPKEVFIERGALYALFNSNTGDTVNLTLSNHAFLHKANHTHGNISDRDEMTVIYRPTDFPFDIHISRYISEGDTTFSGFGYSKEYESGIRGSILKKDGLYLYVTLRQNILPDEEILPMNRIGKLKKK